MEAPFLTIVIPMYNEENHIESTLKETISYLKSKRLPYEIIVVNDGSTDNSVNIVSRFLSKNIKLIDNKNNKGKGYAVKSGVLAAKGQKICFMDADLAYSLNCITNLLERNKSVKVTVGSRAALGSLVEARPSLHRKLLGRAFILINRIMTGINIKDTQCGLKMFDREVASKIFPKQTINGWGFDVELLFLAKKYGYEIEEVPIHLRKEHSFKVSRLNPLKDPLKMFLELLKIRVNDLLGKY